MSDDKRRPIATKIVSDGNGGKMIQDSYLELFRKWAPTALLAVLVWIGKAAVAELISLHDGQLSNSHKLSVVVQQLDAEIARSKLIDADALGRKEYERHDHRGQVPPEGERR